MRELFIDGFAGGGGASTGIAQAIGRCVDIAVNHSPTAIAIHKANHPTTEHFCQDIRSLWPSAATRLRPVGGAWFSPDCKEYSKAKGGPVKDRHIRALSDEVEVWLKETQPRVAYLENVEEYETAGPLDEHGHEIKEMRGLPFKRRVARWRRLGYRVQHRKLRACDYGAPTVRRRLYVLMRRDGLPIVWPKPTHGHPDSPAVKSGRLLPWRTAAECLDWSISCPSIFDRKRELADATKRRIAHGVMRYVVNAARPFIVNIDGVDHHLRSPHITKFYTGSVGADMQAPMPTVTANGQPARQAGATPLGMVEAQIAPFISFGQQGGRNRSADAPMHTVCASTKDTNSIAAVVLQKFASGNAPAQVDEPAQTIECKSKHSMVTAFLSSFYGSDAKNGGGNPSAPLRTVRAGGQHHAIVAAHIEQANGGPRMRNAAGRAATVPLSTVTTTGSQQRLVQTTLVEQDALPPELLSRAVMTAAFLVKYYGTDSDNETAQSQAVDRPMDTVTTKARFAVVTVTIDATTYVIVDIGLRMLTPRELARAQGFPEDYVLDPVVRKFLRGKWVERKLTISEQISAIGNSVCPPVARALVAANQPEFCEREEAQAA
ncbi:DNA cytosine methyltransferase [Novosphingobium rhizosphaerae]|uniref:DNA cytosine methyltransferase n=1 Tax=Novosphingobium rhizosphaerae TaxID=1551649 RepID=UPI0017CBD5B8